MKVLFVVNPVAGGKNHTETVDRLKEKLSEGAVNVQFVMTSGGDDEKQIREAIRNFRPDRVIAAGGDGTIQLVGKLLMPLDLPLGILPLGSANGLATALGIRGNAEEILEHLVTTHRIRPLDMLRFNDEHLCIHLADVGVNALLVKKYEDTGQRGMLGYARHLVSAIQETPLYRFSIQTEGRQYEEQGVMMAFANAHKYGTGVQISEGSVSDGRFEIINVEAVTLEEAIKAGLTILNVFLDDNMFSEVITCREAEVLLNEKAHFQVDGEYMGMTDHLTIEIVPGALKLLN